MSARQRDIGAGIGTKVAVSKLAPMPTYVEGQGGDEEGDDQGHADAVADDGGDAIYNRDNSSLFTLTPPRRAWPAR